MPHQLYEDAYGDPRNAAALANACQIAYFAEEAGREAFKTDLGLDNARLISVDNTQVYVADNDEHLVVAFRGSQDPSSLDGIKDWLLTNAFNLLTTAKRMFLRHLQGVVAEYAGSSEEIEDELRHLQRRLESSSSR